MSAYQTLNFRITGASPLLMHNGQLSDPLSPFSQSLAEVHSKRKKTEADHREMSRREFFGGLYIANGAPCIPGEMLEAMILGSAKKERMGAQAKAGIIVDGNPALEYDGPKDPKELWEDKRFQLRISARVGMARVQRTRPRFDDWALEFEVKFLPNLLNAKNIRSFLGTGGEQVGLGDWRPRFGRFTVA
jgi:hypothetical protein